MQKTLSAVLVTRVQYCMRNLIVLALIVMHVVVYGLKLNSVSIVGIS